MCAVDRDRIRRLAHAEHAIAAPISEHRVRQLVGRLAGTANSLVDLGCGQGQWLVAAALARPGMRSVGVDTSAPALHEARALAARHGLASVEWVDADAATWGGGEYDAVICVGVSHVFGGLTGTLLAARRLLRPGGQVILGDTIWERAPSEAAQRAVDADATAFPDLHGLVQQAQLQRFEVADGHVSTVEEWDDYEWAWTGALVRWALAQPPEAAPQREAALDAAREHR